MNGVKLNPEGLKIISISKNHVLRFKKELESVTGTEINIKSDNTTLNLQECYLSRIETDNTSEWLSECLEKYLFHINTSERKFVSISETFRAALVFHFELDQTKIKKKKNRDGEIVEVEKPILDIMDYTRPNKFVKLFIYDFIGNLIISYLYEYQELTLEDLYALSKYNTNSLKRTMTKVREEYPDLINCHKKHAYNEYTKIIYTLNFDVLESLITL